MWDWKKESKRHLELGYRYAKRHPFSVLSVILITIILTTIVVGYFDGKTLAKVNTTSQSKISFLEGQLTTTTDQLKTQKADYNQKITEHANEIANLKVDYNEKLRSKDAELQKMASERDNALQRIAIMEAMPGGLLSIYTNLAANAPTNLNKFAEILRDITNSVTQNLNIPKFRTSLNNNLLREDATWNVAFSTNRAVFLSVMNDSDVTADKLTIEVEIFADKTNFWSAHDWENNSIVSLKQEANWWTMEANKIVPGRNGFNATTFEISTNYNAPYLDTHIQVFCSTSKIQTYNVKFVYTEIPNQVYEALSLSNRYPNINSFKY